MVLERDDLDCLHARVDGIRERRGPVPEALWRRGGAGGLQEEGVAARHRAVRRRRTGRTEGRRGRARPRGPDRGNARRRRSRGTYPAPTIAAAPAPTRVAENPATGTDPCADPTPQTGVLCGIASQRWTDGFASPVRFWRDRLGAIHITGSARISGGEVDYRALFILPEGARPVEPIAFPVAVTACGACDAAPAILYVLPSGHVSVNNPGTPGQDSVIIGDVQFRPDA
jgi:hypothetical protein